MALLTTAFGLSVAIPTIVIYNYLAHRVDKLIREMEISCVDLLELLTNRDVSRGTSQDFNQEGEIAYEVSSSE